MGVVSFSLCSCSCDRVSLCPDTITTQYKVGWEQENQNSHSREEGRDKGSHHCKWRTTGKDHEVLVKCEWKLCCH